MPSNKFAKLPGGFHQGRADGFYFRFSDGFGEFHVVLVLGAHERFPRRGGERDDARSRIQDHGLDGAIGTDLVGRKNPVFLRAQVAKYP